jgi:hypothetical protein
MPTGTVPFNQFNKFFMKFFRNLIIVRGSAELWQRFALVVPLERFHSKVETLKKTSPTCSTLSGLSSTDRIIVRKFYVLRLEMKTYP